MGSLNGKVAIVTGAGQGLGRAISLELARQGAKVVLATRTVSKAENVKKEIEAFGGEAIAISCDVKDEAQIKATVKATLDAYGTVDILINNAQQFVFKKSIEEHTDEDLRNVFYSGYVAALRFMREVFPIMKEKKYGKILNASSDTAIYSPPGQLAYSSCKAAIRAMTRVAARDWGQYNINVNDYAPCAVSDSMLPSMKEEILSQSPLNTLPSPEDIAKAIVFWVTDDAFYITGRTLFIDGGISIDTAR